MTMCGHPPVVEAVISRQHQLEQLVSLPEQPSIQVTLALTPAQPPEEERVGVTALHSTLLVSGSYWYKQPDTHIALVVIIVLSCRLSK